MIIPAILDYNDVMKKFLNIFFIIISLFASLSANADFVLNTKSSGISCEQVSCNLFPSDAQIFVDIDNSEGTIVSSNSYLEYICNLHRNNYSGSTPCVYSLLPNLFSKNDVIALKRHSYHLFDNISSYLENEIMIGAP